MTRGSLAPPGDKYVLRRPTAPGQTDGPPVYLTREGADVQLGAYTPNLADARRWIDRAAIHRFLRRHSGKLGRRGRLDAEWKVHRVHDQRVILKTSP